MKFISNEICKICFSTCKENRLALTKNYVLLVNETLVAKILDELRQQQIVNEEQREFIARHSTHKGRTRALLELSPRRGPKTFYTFCYALLACNKNDLVSVLTDPEKEDMEVCLPEYSSFHLGGEVYLRAKREEITLKQGAIEMCLPLIRWKQLEYVLDDIDEVVHCLSHNRYASLKRHIGGNAYVSAESSINHRHMSPLAIPRRSVYASPTSRSDPGL